LCGGGKGEKEQRDKNYQIKRGGGRNFTGMNDIYREI